METFLIKTRRGLVVFSRFWRTILKESRLIDHDPGQLPSRPMQVMTLAHFGV